MKKAPGAWIALVLVWQLLPALGQYLCEVLVSLLGAGAPAPRIGSVVASTPMSWGLLLFGGILQAVTDMGISRVLLRHLRSGAPLDVSALLSYGFAHFGAGMRFRIQFWLIFLIPLCGWLLAMVLISEISSALAAIMVWGFALIIPWGIWLRFAYQMGLYRLVDGAPNPQIAWKEGLQIARADPWGNAGFVVATSLFTGVGVLLCCVGVVLTSAAAGAAWTLAYLANIGGSKPRPISASSSSL